MKKIIICLTVFCLLTGCSSATSDKTPVDEEVIQQSEQTIVEPAASLIQEFEILKDFTVDEYFGIGYNLYELVEPRDIDLMDLTFVDLDGNEVNLNQQKAFIFVYDIHALPIPDEEIVALFDYLLEYAFIEYPEYEFYILNLGYDRETNLEILAELGYELEHSMVIEATDQEAYYAKFKQANTFFYTLFTNEGIVEAGTDRILQPYGLDEIFILMTDKNSPFYQVEADQMQILQRNWRDVKDDLQAENIAMLEEICTIRYSEDEAGSLDEFKERGILQPIGQKVDLASYVADPAKLANLEDHKVIVYNFRGYEDDLEKEYICAELAHLYTFVKENPEFKLCILALNGVLDQADELLNMYAIDPEMSLFEITSVYPEALLIGDLFNYAAGLFLDENGYVAAGLDFNFGYDDYDKMIMLKDLAYGENPLYIVK